MSRVLLGWELGAGHGHVRTLLPLARALASAGHEPVFAARDIVETWPVLGPTGFPVLQAPFWPSRRARLDRPFKARCYSDILAFYGWSEPDELEAMVRAWNALLDLVRPALVISDYAPGLCLAAGQRIPVVQVGTGFTQPPATVTPYPVLDPGQQALVPEAALLAFLAEVQRRLGLPSPPSLQAALSQGDRFLTILPELDAYANQRRDENAVGPISPLGKPIPPPRDPAWFAYLNADREDTEALLDALARSGFPGEAYVRGAGAPMRSALRARGIVVHDTPAPLDEAFRRASVVVHPGGMGLSAAALAAGRPQLLLPEHLEQRLTAGRLAGLGVALSIAEAGQALPALSQLVKAKIFSLEASENAANVERRGPWKGLETIADRCRSLLGS